MPFFVAPHKVRRVFCGLFNIRLSTPPIGREAARLWRVERVRFCKRCLGGDLSPSSVAVATNCLQFSSHPRGSLFKIPFGFIQQERNAGIWTAVYICNSIASRNFVCYVRTTERRLPLGGKLSRKRLMRGDQSALTKGIHSPCASRPPIGREAAPCKNPPPPQTTKTFPQEHPPHTKRNKTSHCIGGCSWGEVPGGEGGLEGEEAPFQGGPSPSKVFSPSSSLQLKSAGVELVVLTLFGNQLFVTAALNDPAVI